MIFSVFLFEVVMWIWYLLERIFVSRLMFFGVLLMIRMFCLGSRLDMMFLICLDVRLVVDLL